MVEFVALTDKSGLPVHVNLRLVEYITPYKEGAMLMFTRLEGLAKDKLLVRESPEAIVARAKAPGA